MIKFYLFLLRILTTWGWGLGIGDWGFGGGGGGGGAPRRPRNAPPHPAKK